MTGAGLSGRHRALLTEGQAPTARATNDEQLPSYPTRVVRALLRPRSIRARLSRILLVTVLLVLVMLAFIVSERLTTYRSAAATSRVVTVALTVQDLMHELQRERGMTSGLLGGGGFYGPALDAQRMRTDIARADLDNVLNNPEYAGAAVEDVRGALGKLRDLPNVRRQVDGGQARPGEVFGFYTAASRALTDLQLGLDQASDPDLRNGLQALYALGDVKDYADWARGLLNGVFTANSISPAQYIELAQVRADEQSALQIYNHFATASEQQAVAAVLRSRFATSAAWAEGVAVAALDGQLGQHVEAQSQWWNQMTLLINALREVQQDPVSTDLSARADQLRSSALDQLLVFMALAAMAIAVAVALIVGAARSIIGPLRILATEANTVATDRLPAAVAALEHAAEDEVRPPRDLPLEVPAQASSEIHLMARAVGRLQHTALSLASEQAMIRHNTTTSLANLGRRNQNLVRRQLSLISEFEREELDPAMLANMFELDHLATRMRRNAESLLVLVGESTHRAWAKPLPMVDVVRAALSEVEDYRRVDLKRIDDVYIAGAAATDLAHMLAELIENGLAFSPPEVEVEVFGRRMGSRYTLAVIDHGAGMQPDALVRANARLHDEENFLVAPTRFLGHYVVGRLAKRLGIDVRLVQAPITGITARLVVPESILVESNDWSASDPNRPAALVDQPTVELPSPAREVPSSTGEATPRPSEPVRAAEEAELTPEPAHSAEPPDPARSTEPSDTAEPTESPEPARSPDPAGTPEPARSVHPERLVGQPVPQRVRIDLGAERTRNGLVKRQSQPDRRRPPMPATPPRLASAGKARERTPNEIGTMLASYRAGHQRGAHAGTPSAGPARPDVPDGDSRPAQAAQHTATQGGPE